MSLLGLPRSDLTSCAWTPAAKARALKAASTVWMTGVRMEYPRVWVSIFLDISLGQGLESQGGLVSQQGFVFVLSMLIIEFIMGKLS
ncbi:MAG: hypothetical protein ACM3WS_07445 [Bacillota bacterium]